MEQEMEKYGTPMLTNLKEAKLQLEEKINRLPADNPLKVELLGVLKRIEVTIDEIEKKEPSEKV